MAERAKRPYKPHGAMIQEKPEGVAGGCRSRQHDTSDRGSRTRSTVQGQAMTSLDSFKCRKILKVGTKSYVHYSLAAAEKNGLRGISRLPFSMKVLLEHLL